MKRPFIVISSPGPTLDGSKIPFSCLIFFEHMPTNIIIETESFRSHEVFHLKGTNRYVLFLSRDNILIDDSVEKLFIQIVEKGLI